jgi:outer membrane protein
MIRIIYCLLGLIGVSTVCQAQSTMDLNQLLDSAIQRNHLLQSNRKQTSIILSEIKILATNYQPRVSVSASFSYWKFLLPNKERLLGEMRTDMYNDISFYQTIYDWGENKEKKSLIEEEILLNKEVYRQIHNTIIWGVSDAYFAALKAESDVETHANALQQLKSDLKYTENLYNIGRVSSVDVLKIQVQIGLEEKALQIARNAALEQFIKIRRLCNLDETPQEVMNNSGELFLETQDQIFFPNDLYRQIFINHPSLLMSDKRMKIEATQKNLFRFQNSPELFAYGIGSWEHGYIPLGDNFNYNIGVGLRYDLPWWGGSAFRTKMQQSDMRLEQMDDEKSQIFLDIKKEVDLTLNEINDKKMEISNNEKIIQLAKETLNNAWIKYQSGQGPIIDVLDARSILTDITIDYNKSKISYLQALVKLHYLIGNDDYPF